MPDALSEFITRVINLPNGSNATLRAATAFEYAACAMFTAFRDSVEAVSRVCNEVSLILSLEGL